MTTATRSYASDLSHDDTETLRATISGDVIAAGDERYETARRAHDITLDRHPAIIVRPAIVFDVVEAVRFARAKDLEIAVRSGGHSAAGHSVVNGALVVDLSSFRAVQVDPATRIARVQAGARTEDIMGPAHACGLALTTGDTSTVGLGGLVTGGGIGWMVRKYGLTIDNLLSVQVVTAEGSVLRASTSENADLFWAIRGGGGNFGIVTEFEFLLAPVGAILGGALVLPATPAVVRGYLDFMAAAPDDLTTIAQLMHCPPAPFVPESAIGELVLVVLVCYTGDPIEDDRVLDPLRALATPIADAIAPIPYPVIYQFTAAAAAPHGSCVRSMFASELPDDAIDAMFEAMGRATSPMSMVQVRQLGGAMARVPAGATAFAHRDANLLVTILGLWQSPEDDGVVHTTWAEGLWAQVKHLRDGVYSNFLANEGEARVREAYPPSTHARLAEVKRRYDPANVFHYNQNIRPRN